MNTNLQAFFTHLSLEGTKCTLANKAFKIFIERRSFKFSVRLLLQYNIQTDRMSDVLNASLD